jgi:integrase
LSRTFGAKSQAAAWARKVESELERGVWRDTSAADRTTLSECLDRYELEVTPSKRSAKREESHLRILRDLPIINMAMSRIRSADLAAVRDAWLRADHAPATVVRRLALLSHVFATAQKAWGMESLANPLRAVEAPKVRNARTRRVTDEEVDAICSACASTEMRVLIRFALATAMRRGELCALRWEDVAFQLRTAHLPQTKNGHARTVPLSSSAVYALRQLPAKAKGLVFALRPDSVTQAFERAVARARRNYDAECEANAQESSPSHLADLRFHDLRHEATTRLADRLQIHELGAVTGHRDLRMIQRYYHPQAADLAKKLG